MELKNWVEKRPVGVKPKVEFKIYGYTLRFWRQGEVWAWRLEIWLPGHAEIVLYPGSGFESFDSLDCHDIFLFAR